MGRFLVNGGRVVLRLPSGGRVPPLLAQRTREKWGTRSSGVWLHVKGVGVEDEIVAFAVAPGAGDPETEAGGFQGEG